MSKEEKKHSCHCGDGCTCGDNCTCDETHKCNDNCTCGEHNHECHCGDDCECNHNDCKENEYLELAQRIKAEFDNYKRRNAEISSQSFNNGVVATVTKLLPALDAFKQARTNIKDEDTLKGVVMIESLILGAMKELGVEKIDCLGQEFNPHYHNAVLTASEADKPDNVVLEEYQEGFKLNDRVIRHSVVKINKL